MEAEIAAVARRGLERLAQAAGFVCHGDGRRQALGVVREGHLDGVVRRRRQVVLGIVGIRKGSVAAGDVFGQVRAGVGIGFGGVFRLGRPD